MFACPMSPLFRKSEKKVAEEAAAQVEIKRLKALSAEDLAMLVLPGLGPNGVKPGSSVRVQLLCNDLLRGFPGAGNQQAMQLFGCVTKALESLERADLVSSISYSRLPVWRITHLGEAALADGTIDQHLRKAG